MLSRFSLPRTVAFAVSISFIGCSDSTSDIATANSVEQTPGAGQSAVKDDVSQKNVVQVAAGSADHSTLVAAV